MIYYTGVNRVENRACYMWRVHLIPWNTDIFLVLLTLWRNFFVLLYFDFDFLIPFYNNLVWFKAVLLRTRICPRK